MTTDHSGVCLNTCLECFCPLPVIASPSQISTAGECNCIIVDSVNIIIQL